MPAPSKPKPKHKHEPANPLTASPAVAKLQRCTASALSPDLTAAAARQQAAMRADVQALLAEAMRGGKTTMPKAAFAARIKSIQDRYMDTPTSRALFRVTVAKCEKEVRSALALMATTLQADCDRTRDRRVCAPAERMRKTLARKAKLTAKDYMSSMRIFQ